MNTSTPAAKALLILLLISVMPFARAQTETEYLGLTVDIGPKDDKKYGPLPIGFDFDFFGNIYTEFYVSSNGLVLFDAGSNAFSNVSIPDDARPDNYIAPFWDDLIIHSSGDIMYQTIGTAPNRKLVIQFNNMSFWTSTVLLGTFQVILYEGSDNIQIQYKSIVDLSSDRSSGGEATVGLENSDGTAGVLCSYSTPGYIYSGRTILFTPGGGTYTYDDQALYENIILVDAIPRAGIPNLVSPTNNSSVQETITFIWEAAPHASSYFIAISQNSDMSSPFHTSADLTNLSYEYTLTPDQTYYWTANAKNSAGDISLSEIWSFKTSSTPDLGAVPQTIQLEQGDIQILPLYYTGGDNGPKTATITSLPGEGVLFQNAAGSPGTQITSVPTDVSDPFFSVIYSASGGAGNNVGSFDFLFTDGSGSSPEETFTIHVSPPGIPNFLYAAKETDRVELTFDREMADPSGLQAEFAVEDNGVGVASASCELKSGDPNTIVLYVSPGINTANVISVAYTRGSVTSASGGILESFDFQLAAKLAQTISFDALTDKTYGDPDYALVAAASSGLAVSFSSSNATIVTVSGTTATINNAGETIITAAQAGDATYAPATYAQYQLVNKPAATVTLSDLTHDYTGTGVSAIASTVPPGLNVVITYDGSTDLPVDLGSYTVLARINDPDYDGSASDILTISDLSAPVPDMATLPTLLDDCSVTPPVPTATDLNTGLITGTTGTPIPVTTQGTTIITWTYDDGNGNTSTQTQSVVINDDIDPLTPVLSEQILDCGSIAIAPTTTDACAGTITGTTTDPLTYPAQGTYIITWTFDDGNGNSIVVPQDVLVSDLNPPQIPVLQDLNGECSVTATAPIATDACAGTITGTTTDPLTYSTQGTFVITWTFDDGNGNSIQVAQNVVVDDVTPPLTPVLPDQNGECSVTATAPVTTDACAGTVTGTTTDPLTYSTQGTFIITWTFDDGNGNSIQVAQQVAVTDMTPPTASVPSDAVTCDGSVNSIGLSNVTDNCSVMPVVSYQLSGATTGNGDGEDAGGEQFNPGITTVTYTLDDGNGNSSQYQVMITYPVADPIVVTIADGTLSCETAGDYQWISCADNTIIPGETSGSFSPGESGEYAVIVTQGGCADTSGCYLLDFTGIGDESLQEYRVYPNPVRDYLSIDMTREHTYVSIRVFDMTGNLLKIEELDRLTKTELDLSEFKPGLYMINIQSEQINTVSRVIKE